MPRDKRNSHFLNYDPYKILAFHNCAFWSWEIGGGVELPSMQNRCFFWTLVQSWGHMHIIEGVAYSIIYYDILILSITSLRFLNHFLGHFCAGLVPKFRLESVNLIFIMPWEHSNPRSNLSYVLHTTTH